MKKLLFIIGMFIAFSISAQDISDNLTTETMADLCKPGVINKSPGKGLLLSYMSYPNYQISAPTSRTPLEISDNNRLLFKLKIPFINKPGMKVLLGAQYFSEKLNFEDNKTDDFPLFDRLNTATLKSAEGAFYLSKSLSSQHFITVKASARFSGDYDKFLSIDNRYAIYRVVGLFGIKKTEDTEYGFGFLYSHGFRKTVALPFGFFNRTFSDKWGIELGIPVSLKARYNIKPGSLLLFGADYASRSYSIDVNQPDPSVYHYRRSAIEFSVAWQKRFTDWTWLEFKAGYARNLTSKARDVVNDDNYRFSTTSGFFGSVSFFISPPDRFCN
jgi:hypothetical protein